MRLSSFSSFFFPSSPFFLSPLCCVFLIRCCFLPLQAACYFCFPSFSPSPGLQSFLPPPPPHPPTNVCHIFLSCVSLAVSGSQL